MKQHITNQYSDLETCWLERSELEQTRQLIKRSSRHTVSLKVTTEKSQQSKMWARCGFWAALQVILMTVKGDVIFSSWLDVYFLTPFCLFLSLVKKSLISSWRIRCPFYGVFSLRGLLPGSALWLSLFSTLMGLNFAPFFFCCCCCSPSGSLWKSWWRWK